MDFEILIDSSLLELGLENVISPSANKRLLSIVNDYEDGVWRQPKFDHFIWDNIAQTALNYKERSALGDQPQSLLIAAAKNLRLTDAADDVGKGSELAEIVLYGIMRHKYRALPVVPKIFYKQNSQDNAKGADSVHIVLGTGDDFSLWFGEAKFYNSIEDARLAAIIASIQASLSTEKLKKENSIIINLPELNHLEIPAATREAIKKALDNKQSIDSLKPRLNVPILIIHECSITASAVGNTPEHLEKLRAHHKDRARSYFEKHVAALNTIFKYAEIRFHLILFPVPEKKPIVDKFVASVEYYKS